MERNIDYLMALLDWNNSQELQKSGINAAMTVSDLSIFLQPVTPNYSKNVWDNCAKILCRHSDAELEPYLLPLLEWLQDLTWPGALLIMERLSQYLDQSSFTEAINNCKKNAIEAGETIWLQNMEELSLYRWKAKKTLETS